MFEEKVGLAYLTPTFEQEYILDYLNKRKTIFPFQRSEFFLGGERGAFDEVKIH